MNKVLSKRLLGAGVVVALAAMILPFLLQGAGYKANQQLSAEANKAIPQRPPVPVSLDTEVPEPAGDVRNALVEPQPLPVPVPVPKSVTSPPVPAKPAEAQKLKQVPKPTVVAPAPAPVASQAPGTKTAPSVAAPKPPAETKPVPSAAPALPSTQSAEVKAGMWFIQLGSFTAESNAQNLLAQVQRAGVSARVEKIDVNGNSVWRVSSGSYATREEADAALGRLKARLNLGGMVKQVR
jgi:DedD protein